MADTTETEATKQRHEIAMKIDGVWFYSEPVEDPLLPGHFKRTYSMAREVEEVRINGE